ncbi:tRNA pseudouridine(55) synthase TruB [Spiroplasma platyhelix]|uniref:tRNA pseudouridine(55) synthase TruB n=1 Tax=Spiroplasma platyhelix TaxID=301585 RepID=UPI001F43E1ED|nr:tRNA pseudouridine(55) synthase TruB [Spiroplasma platyhelix]MBE4703976.1 tRNA pseudouridine synthase B [Spiroplasma platyhelix PALS-1]UJB29234.1 tRNA pseudouridine synthase B [Spiroplasma platyhelix PALS-1]
MLKDYILLIDKPAYMTSQDCLTILKQRLRVKKIGHTGTLDPIATGLMVVLVNEATKLSNFILALDKTYIATMQLFIRTDTGDISGNVVENNSAFKISEESLRRVFNAFDNIQYEQVVPLYSAVKKEGQKLYQYAYKNQPVELPKRMVSIKRIKFLTYNNNFIQFQVTCSKGTYIRALIGDIAASLKTVATMTSLRRIQQSEFSIQDALTLEEITDEKSVKSHMISIVEGLKHSLKVVTITNRDTLSKIKHGKQISLPDIEVKKEVLLVNNQKQPLAIYANEKGTTYISKRGFNLDESNKD